MNDLNKISTVPEKKTIAKTSEGSQLDQSCKNSKSDKKETKTTDKTEIEARDKNEAKPNDSQKAWNYLLWIKHIKWDKSNQIMHL